MQVVVGVGMETDHPGLDMFKNEGSMYTSNENWAK